MRRGDAYCSRGTGRTRAHRAVPRGRRLGVWRARGSAQEPRLRPGVTDGPDRSRVDDLAQDVFLKVHRGLPYFRGEARLSTWIYRIVQNVCAAARYAPAARRLARSGRWTGRRSSRAPPTVRLAISNCATVSRRRSPSCPSQHRLLIAAHYLEGVQYEALAEAMNIPLGTVKTHLYRAKRRLQGVARHVTCTDALHLVEAIAAGDLEVDATPSDALRDLPAVRRRRWRPPAGSSRRSRAPGLRRRRASPTVVGTDSPGALAERRARRSRSSTSPSSSPCCSLSAASPR